MSGLEKLNKKSYPHKVNTFGFPNWDFYCSGCVIFSLTNVNILFSEKKINSEKVIHIEKIINQS